MKDISITKLVIIGLVTLLSVFFTVPTARYYSHLRTEVTPNGTPPVATRPEPPSANIEDHTRWETENKPLVDWRKTNAPYVAWKAENDRLKNNRFAIPLGLDLQGGVDVTLIIDREKSITNEVQNNMTDLQKMFDKDKLNAKPLQTTPDGQALLVQLTDKKDAQRAANLINQYKGKIFNESVTADQLATMQPFKLTLNTVELDNSIKANIDGAKKGVEDRINGFGVSQSSTRLQGADRIRVQVPGYSDPERLIANVIKPAQLEFHLVHPDSDSLIDGTKLRAGAQLPLGTEVYQGEIADEDKKTGELTKRPTAYVLYKNAEITGANLTHAAVSYDSTQIEASKQIQVALEFDKEGTQKFAKLTTEHANKNHRMAILLENKVRSAPTINEPITDGRAQIFGSFSQSEATELSQIFKAGALKAPLKVESKRTVGATLGQQSVVSGVKALAGGGLLIAVFMILYYGTAGVIAVITLILNILMVLAIMALSKATLTLSGIGGLLLTIGMAVDGNVLIYERIREELRNGRPLRQAINLGYHRAFAVIFDSHITTLMCALVLLQFTEGSVFGFALTMAFGLIANLYTSLTVTHTLCMLWYDWRGNLSLGKLAIFSNPKIDFIKLRNFSFGISIAITIIALVWVFGMGGLKYGVDFAGGFHADVQFNQKVGEEQIRTTLSPSFGETTVQTEMNKANYFLLDVPLLKLSNLTQKEKEQMPNAQELSDLSYTQSKLETALQSAFPGQFEIKSTTGFGSQSGQEFAKLAILVVVLASLAIVAYLWFRFELVFGVAAVVALLHDLLLVVLLCTLWKVQINLDVVAALMVLMGFSVNDTIVIFDRIRENSRAGFSKDFGTICNNAMNQSLSRTLLTSGTVFLAVLALYFIGGEGLRPFAKVYLLGTITGTYSSDFIATPLVYLWNKWNNNAVLNQLQQKKKRGGGEGAKPVGRVGARPITAR